ncbi:MAG: ABC transporter ATP-binding protein [Candidatus Saccharibacteria bacterium]
MRIKNLAKYFDGVRAVDDVSVQFRAGKITGLIGPNGSGKSTLVDLLTGFLPADKGLIYIQKQDGIKSVNPSKNYSSGISRTFQDARLFEQMTVLDNILVVLTKRNVLLSLFEQHTESHLKQSEKVLKKVGLWKKRGELAKNLSYGQRKLLGIARTLAMNGDTYYFDEPLSGLFPEMVATVKNVLQDLKKDGKTVILIDHNMDFIRSLCDTVIVLDSGKILAEGNPSKVLAKKEVIDVYLGA